jgi:hypothetical protein
MFIQLQHTADIHYKDVFIGHPQFVYQLSMLFEMLVFPVYRHEILGTGKAVYKLQFLLAGMAGYMYVIQGFVDYACAFLDKLVYNS